MKRVFVLTLVVSLALTLCFATASSASASPPEPSFSGVWWSIDVDGSHQTLVISPRWRQAGAYSVFYFDDGASVCGCDTENHPLYAGIGYGTGSAVGTDLSVTFDFWCLSRWPRRYGSVSFHLGYDAVHDILEDEFGVVWHRIGRR